jgi:rfaE bifunctional protein nucleotidyltransferase chain/domain
VGHVVQKDELVRLRSTWKKEGKTVVFTNGCFDLIHRGHIEYLTKAKLLGTILVVGVNTDSSVKKMKGEKRPIVPQNDRVFIVANLAPVDYACLFDEETPLHLITALLPDVLVKGADWNVDDVVGKDVVERAGGRVMTIEFVPNRSTTSLIERIVQRFGNN